MSILELKREYYQLTPMGPARRCLTPNRPSRSVHSVECHQHSTVGERSSTVGSTCEARLPSRHDVLSTRDSPLSPFVSHSPTVGVPWRNFPSPEFGTEFLIFDDTLISLKHAQRIGKRVRKISLIRASVSIQYRRRVTDTQIDTHTMTELGLGVELHIA